MTIPDSAKRRIEEACRKPEGPEHEKVLRVICAEFGYQLAKSELEPLLRDALEWIKKNHEMPHYSELLSRIEEALKC